jgi:hypothetical protein
LIDFIGEGLRNLQILRRQRCEARRGGDHVRLRDSITEQVAKITSRPVMSEIRLTALTRAAHITNWKRSEENLFDSLVVVAVGDGGFEDDPFAESTLVNLSRKYSTVALRFASSVDCELELLLMFSDSRAILLVNVKKVWRGRREGMKDLVRKAGYPFDYILSGSNKAFV